MFKRKIKVKEFSDTLKLERALMKRYGNTPQDKECIKHLCFARNVAERVAVHYNNTKNKEDFYAAVLCDKNLETAWGYATVEKYYSYLVNNYGMYKERTRRN